MAITINRQATWNKVGTDIRKATTAAEALEFSGLNYEVVKVPVYLSNGYKVPGAFATKKKGLNDTFGIVGSDYTVVQNSEAFSFIDGIIPEGLTFEKAGETKKMNYIIASLPSQYILKDEFKPYIIFQNSHSGNSSLRVAICPLRIVCQNQFSRAFRTAENSISLRHTNTIKGRMAEAQEVLKFSASYMDTFHKEALEMANIKLSDSQVFNVIDEYFVVDEEATDRKANNIEEKRNIFLNAYNSEDNQNFKGTAWGMVNAFSDYITHLNPGRNTDTAATRKFIKVTLKNNYMEQFINLVMAKA